ncbi:MAG: hypothetical protein MJ252_27615, partial [archaeon]|nr:hypothetical protein [archaeon]
MSSFSQQICDKFFKFLNNYRKNPKSITRTMNAFKLGLSRFKSKQNSEFAESIDSFRETLDSRPECVEMELNPTLCEYAEKEINSIKPKEELKFIEFGEDIKEKIPPEYEDEECVIIKDDYVADAERFLIKILINKEDTERVGRNLLNDDSYTQVGVFFKEVERKEGIICAIFAKNKVEPKKEEEVKKVEEEEEEEIKPVRGAMKRRNKKEEEPKVELPEGDLTELKMAFDLFDLDKAGQIDTLETFKMINDLGYNEQNPELFNIMKDLKREGRIVDWPTFASFVNKRVSDSETRKGLRNIFNCYVDDSENETISLPALKKICINLNEDDLQGEVEKLLDLKGGNIRLTFDEFYEFMNDINNKDE